VSFAIFPINCFLFVCRTCRSFLLKKTNGDGSRRRVSKVEMLAILSMFCWILQDVQTQLSYCFISCSYNDGFVLKTSTATYAMANVINYLFMIEKHKAFTKGLPILKPRQHFFFSIKAMVMTNGIIAVLFSFLPMKVIDTGFACVATAFSTRLLLLFYVLMDICITFGGLYLFYQSFQRTRNYGERKKERIINVEERYRNLGGPSAGSEIYMVRHSHGDEDQDAPVPFLDEKTTRIIKWNLIGVIVGQIPTLFIGIFSVVVHSYSFMSYRRLVIKPIASHCNVIGVHLMFQDHRFIFKIASKILKSAKVVPISEEAS